MIWIAKVKSKNWWFENKIVILYLLVVAFFYAFISFAITNIPFFDDHNAFYRFLNYFERRGWESVFAQHNEHRIVCFKLLVLLDEYITTSVNITHYIWLGVLCLLGITLILYYSFKINDNKLLHFFPVLSLIFVPVTQMHNWGMATFANITAIFFVFISLYFLHKKSNVYFSLALLFSVLATFSNASGTFIYAIGFFVLIFKKRWLALFIWLITAIFCLFLYFNTYKMPSHRGPLIDRIPQVDQIILGVFKFMGSGLKSLLRYPDYITVAGAIVTNVALSAGASSVLRGYYAVSTNRYHLIHVLGLGLIYLSTLEAFPGLFKKYLKIIIGLSLILFAVRLLDNIPATLKHKERLEASYLAYISNDIEYIDTWPHAERPPELIKKILDESVKNGTYIGHKKIIPKPRLYDAEKLEEISSKANVHITRFKNSKKGLIIHGNAFFDNWRYNVEQQSVSVILQSDSLSYIFPSSKYRYYKPTIAKALNKKKESIKNNSHPAYSAFYFNLPKDEISIANNNYKIGILVKEGDKPLAISYLDEIISKN